MRLARVLALALAPLLASAQGLLSTDDARAMRGIVEAQLEAFQHDDAPRAFSYATPGIQETFRTPEIFLEMVRSSYGVVYRPRSVAFGEPLVSGGEVLQPVRMTDAEGRPWLALYPMERQADGGWRINGCRLLRLKGQET